MLYNEQERQKQLYEELRDWQLTLKNISKSLCYTANIQQQILMNVLTEMKNESNANQAIDLLLQMEIDKISRMIRDDISSAKDAMREYLEIEQYIQALFNKFHQLSENQNYAKPTEKS